MRAHCQCGQLAADFPGPTPNVVACHCIYCQRRSGSPFGVLAYYQADQVALAGEWTSFMRPSDNGGRFETLFCPHCGSTVAAKTTNHPGMIGIAIGAMADPLFQSPVRSVWETSKHHWVNMPKGVQHFVEGRPR